MTGRVTPVRVQLRRTKGWRMPPNTVKVDRSTPWGNPFSVGLVTCRHRGRFLSESDCANGCKCNVLRRETAAEAVQAFSELPRSEKRMLLIHQELAGKNLACWCEIGAPCHADVLLRLANAALLDEITDAGG